MGSRSHESFSSFSSSSSSRASTKRWRYEVFLSFRGTDTRLGFTGHLRRALEQAGVEMYMDDKSGRGEYIPSQLMQAIQGSRMCVIVFSRRYADSRWCLQELVKFMECRRVLKQIVCPIFYDVDPSDVRNQTGTFATAFLSHEERIREGKFKNEEVQQWRNALNEAGNMSGKDFNTKDGEEANFIKKIVNEITGKMNIRDLDVATYQVGIDPRVQDIGRYLSVGGLDDVRIIGISGIGGMGKTTIAKAIYNKYKHSFEGKSFLENVSEQKLVDLQQQLLSEILNSNKIEVKTVSGGKAEIKRRFRSIRVLVIIDGINHAKQLDALAIGRDSFGAGSRIVITTTEEDLLTAIEMDKICSAQAMNETEALELLSWHAFRSSFPLKEEFSEYSEFAREFVRYCEGLPLALQVLGRFLHGKSTEVWKSRLEILKKIPDKEIHEKLKISYDGLNQDYEKDIFLDISCFFIGMAKSFVMSILDGCYGFSTEAVISVLLDRCLVTVDEGNNLTMHGLIRNMGREVVRAKSPNVPGNRSRLWDHEDVTSVLRNKSGTEEIKGLTLDKSDEPSFSTRAFRKMRRLRLLQLKDVKLIGPHKHLSQELRWLSWHGFPLDHIPEDFNQRNLVAIDLSYSFLVQVWKYSNMSLEKLKFLDLSHSNCLTQSPDFSKLPNLVNLMIEDCRSLSKVHHSLVRLKNLTHLSLAQCCLTDDVIPEDLGSLPSLEVLDLGGSDFHRLPILSGLSKLKRLFLNFCRNLQVIPDLPTSLEILEADECPTLERMPNFSTMSSMRELRVQRSLKLVGIPGLNNSLNSMREIHMEGCTNLTATFKKTILQGWNSSGYGGLFLSGNEIPGWFKYANKGHIVSFQLPQSIGGNLKALTVCIVYSSDNSKSNGSLDIRVVNHTQRTNLTIRPMLAVVISSHEDYLWMGHLSNNILNLDAGDEVHVYAMLGSAADNDNDHFQVKKTGVNLERRKHIKEYKLDCESNPYTHDEDYEADKDDDEDEEDEDEDD